MTEDVLPPRPQPQAVIVDIQRHLQGGQPGMRLDRRRVRLEHDLLTLQAVDKPELCFRQLTLAFVATAAQSPDGLILVAVADEKIQVPEAAKAQVTKGLHGEDGPLER